MDLAPIPAFGVPWTVPVVPGWAVPRGPVADPAEAAFLAGAALNCLDNLVRAEPAWAGAWRARLALQCAAAAARHAGRSEDENALRDAWVLRPPHGDPGPSGGRDKSSSKSYAKVERSRNVVRHAVAQPGGEAI